MCEKFGKCNEKKNQQIPGEEIHFKLSLSGDKCSERERPAESGKFEKENLTAMFQHPRERKMLTKITIRWEN